MAYESILVLFIIAIPLMAGLALVVDAVRRAIKEGRKSDHDVHV